MKAISEADARGLLRCCTVGSVDDGKSTLLGRLMLDSKAIMTDHLIHVEEASRRRGFGRVELALLTDGLRAEREQGITIDIAWRYFATQKRSFVLADAPGHVQYTRNMLTGASTSDAILLLIDARRGPTAQTKRHVALTAMLGVPSVLVCINKMDEVGFNQARWNELAQQVSAMFEPFVPSSSSGRGRGRTLEKRTITTVPVAALDGDNVVSRSSRTPWYDGPTVIEWLESTHGSSEEKRLFAGDSGGAVLPVQWVVRPQSDAHRDYRGWAGRIERGTLSLGDAVTLFPSNETAHVTSIARGGVDVERASQGQSVIVRLDRDIDASRGDVLVAGDVETRPKMSSTHVADLFWLSSSAARVGARYLIKHLTTRTLARLVSVSDSLDIDSLSRVPADTLCLNEVGRVELRSARPLAWLPYDEHRSMGSFVLIDETSGDTVGAGLLREPPPEPDFAI